MRDQREQILFVVVLVLAGWLTYSRFDERATRVVLRSAGQLASVALEAPPAVHVGRVVVDDLPGSTRDRPLFAPPRELLPLDPVTLPAPPVPSLPVRRPAMVPSLQGEFAKVYRLQPEDMGHLRLGDGAGGSDVGDDEVSAPSDGGAAAATDEVVRPPEETYDWIEQTGLRRIYGRILNDDPHGLSKRPSEPIRFQQVSVTNGRPLGAAFSVARGELAGFALADTFENRAIAKSRALGTSVGSAASRKALALELLASWPAEPQALELAEAEAERAHAASGHDPSTARLLAAIRRRAHDLEGEISLYVTAESEGWADAPLYCDHAAFALSMGLVERARELVEQAGALTSTSAEVRAMRGRLLLHDRRYEEALVTLRSATQVSFSEPFVDDQRNALAVDIGTTLIALGRPEEAVEAANNVLLKQPDQRDALNLLAAAHAAANELDAAAEAVGDLLTVAPEHGPSLTNAAVLAWRQGDGESALRLAQTARDVDPFHAVEPTLVVGFLHEDAGRPQQARDDYADALRLDPGDPEALYRMGRVQRLDGDAEGATATLHKALRLRGPEVLLLAELALAALDLQRPEAAARYCKEALRLEGDNGRVHWLLGLSLLRQGDVGGAIEALDRAASEGEAGAHSALGVAHYLRGDEQVALEHFDEVARAFAGRSEHPVAVYADDAAAAIRDNLSKRQWLDRFVRSTSQLQRGWEERQWDGSPRVFLDGVGVRVQGRMEKTRENERPGIQRPVEGRGFFSAEAQLACTVGHQGRYGVALTYRQAKGVLGRLPKAELDIWVGEDGLVRTSVLDGFDKLVVDGAVIEGVRVEAGESVTLGVERLDLVGGEFQFLVDGRRVGEPVVVKALRTFDNNQFDLLVYAEAAPGRMVDAGISLVRIVQAP
ncbi:MAG: tetratricopeptide repeat protein [Planctomycetes bacterium]|nr:tetratricopeptide repeat protein [Planctomycetota bacterium]